MKTFFTKLAALEAWQKKRLFSWLAIFSVMAGIFLTYAITTVHNDRAKQDANWEYPFTVNEEIMADVERIRGESNPTEVAIGTYLEDLKDFSLKNGTFRLTSMVWFKWKGNDDLNFVDNFRVYKGYINRSSLIEDITLHDGTRYQSFRVDVTITKQFETSRFPLESHQLRMYIEPDYTINEVVLVDDKESNSYASNISITGYEICNYDTGIFYYRYPTDYGHGEYSNGKISSEHITAIELNRSSVGVYLKCFIALFGTTSWVLIVLYICTFHRVDPLGMLPAALFGTVTNIMVGANLLPDALDLGLLEFINFWGIFTIITVTVGVININRIRNKFEDRDFAKFFGKTVFFFVLMVIILGHTLIPLAAYKF